MKKIMCDSGNCDAIFDPKDKDTEWVKYGRTDQKECNYLCPKHAHENPYSGSRSGKALKPDGSIDFEYEERQRAGGVNHDRRH